MSVDKYPSISPRWFDGYFDVAGEIWLFLIRTAVRLNTRTFAISPQRNGGKVILFFELIRKYVQHWIRKNTITIWFIILFLLK